MLTNIKYFVIPVIFFFSNNTFLPAQTPPEFFGTQYTDAIEKIKEEKKRIQKHCDEHNINPALAISVVFPEMLRYTLWRDMFETTALKLMYVQYGSKAADFSIGWFQMKPSFAENLEAEILKDAHLRLHFKKLILYKAPTNDTVSLRTERLSRLQSFDWQLIYLGAFILINIKKYENLKVESKNYLLLLSAAYNRGMEKSIQELLNFLTLKTFPYGPGKQNPFGYVELSNHFYLNETKVIFKTTKTN